MTARSSPGTLPAGIAFDTDDGTFSGTPTEVGSFPITVEVTDDQGNTGQKAYTLTVVPVDNLQITPDTVPDGVFGVAYSQQLSATGGDGAYVFSLGSGALPAGVTLSGAGLISGTPTETGDFSFQVDVSDGQSPSNTGQETYTLTVAADSDLLTIAPATLPDGSFDTAYSQQLTASGGVGPYAYALSSGSLPAGLALSAGGLISGDPSETGSFPVTVKATDAEGNMGEQAYTLAIDPVSGIITITPPQFA